MTLNKEKSLKLVEELNAMALCVPDLINIAAGANKLDFLNGYLDHFHKLNEIIDDAIIEEYNSKVK